MRSVPSPMALEQRCGKFFPPGEQVILFEKTQGVFHKIYSSFSPARAMNGSFSDLPCQVGFPKEKLRKCGCFSKIAAPRSFSHLGQSTLGLQQFFQMTILVFLPVLTPLACVPVRRVWATILDSPVFPDFKASV